MKVLFLTSSYPVPEHPWLGIFVREHARAVAPHAEVAVALLDRSDDVRGIHVEDDADTEFTAVRVRYPARPAPLSYLSNVVAAALAYARLRRRGFEPDVIHAHFFLAGAPAVALGKLLGKPVVVTEQWSVFLPDDPMTLSPAMQRVARFTYEHADVVMPVSEALRFGSLNQGLCSFLLQPLFVAFKEFLFRWRRIVGLLKKMSEGNIGQMNGYDCLWMTAGELFGDCTAPISAVRRKARITQPLRHKVRPQIMDVKYHSMFRRLIGKTIARQIWYYHIKGIFGASAEGGRIGEHGDYFRESKKRIGIAMGENDGERSRTFPSLVNKVDADAVNFSFEMRESIERGFLLPPVVSVLPIVDEFLKVIETGACIPICSLQLIRPPRVFQSLLQVAQDLRSDFDSECSDFIVFHSDALACAPECHSGSMRWRNSRTDSGQSCL